MIGSMLIRRCLVFLMAVSVRLAYGQGPGDASLALLVQMVSPTGVLRAETRDIFLKESGLSGEQAHTVSNVVAQASELQNLEGSAARMRKQPGVDFNAIEGRRREMLREVAAILEKALGPDGWAKLRSLLQSIEQKMEVRRSLCNSNSV